MKIVNKICFYLNFTRDIAMYSSIFSKIKSKKICFVFNDLYKARENNNRKEFVRINNYLKEHFPKYRNIKRLSQIINSDYKFKVLVSAGDLPISIISVKSLIKFLAKKILFKHNAEFYEKKFVEKNISNYSIRFPNNLDRNVREFPSKIFKNIFNSYFVSLKIEEKLINKKFGRQNIYPIGFPKLDINTDKKKLKKSLIKEFKLDKKKKIIFYLPTLTSAQSKSLLEKIILDLKKLGLKYNIVVRLHPKDKDANKIKYNLFKKSKLKLDLQDGRDTSELINTSDYIITDGGSTVLETIYLKKKILIHNWKKFIDNKKLENRLTDKMRLDNILASKLINFENFKNLPDYLKKANNRNYSKKIVNFRNQIFFQSKKINIISKLNNYLND